MVLESMVLNYGYKVKQKPHNAMAVRLK